ncbi:T9SS type B sorting domain-containing protein [Puteibacter caeruleilacunae]|nr:T9SS type B sorting domain-containing protein [Puteibacter caeruleilacunae]
MKGIVSRGVQMYAHKVLLSFILGLYSIGVNANIGVARNEAIESSPRNLSYINNPKDNEYIRLSGEINPIQIVCQEEVALALNNRGEGSISVDDVEIASSAPSGIKSMSLSQTDFSCADLGDNIIQFTVTDNDGHQKSKDVRIVVEDNIKPNASCSPYTLELDAMGHGTLSVDDINYGSFDNCGIPADGITLSETEFVCDEVGFQHIDMKVRDASGNTSQCMAMVTVVDHIRPVARANDITIYLDEFGNASVDAKDVDDGSSDNCSIQGMYLSKMLFDCDDVGENEVTLTVYDKSGNFDDCKVIVTVEDAIKPIAKVKPNIIKIPLDENGVAVVPTNQINNRSSDNCGVKTMTSSPASFSCDDVGMQFVTLVVEDVNGNVAESKKATVEVVDYQKPTFTVPADIEISRKADGSYDASVAAAGDVTDAADNCGIREINHVDDLNDSDPCELIIKRTWTVIDNNDNESFAQVQTITIKDNTLPTFTAPADITIYKDANCSYDKSVSATGDVTDEADNFGVGQATYTDNVDNSNPCEIIIKRTWSLRDNCGNDAPDQVQTITVQDNTPPTFTVPADIVVARDASCNYNVTTAVTGDVTDEADNCGAGEALFSDATNDADPCEIVITRTWTLTDVCGNATVKTQTIRVVDNTPPTFTAPLGLTIYKNSTGGFDASIAVTGDVTNEADNCGVGQATFKDVVAPGACEGEEIISRTWSLVDNCGNAAADQVQVITVKDNEAPDFTVPADITIYKDKDCNYDASVAVTGDVTDEHDNCDTSLDATYDQVITPGKCAGELTIIRGWTLEDDCGNNVLKVQTIHVTDIIAPTFTVPADQVLYRDASGNYDATVAVTGDVTDEADNCGVGEATFHDDIDDSNECEVVIKRTWSLHDECGNPAADQVQTITIRDNTAPTFTAPADQVLYRDAAGNYDVSVAVTGDVTNEKDNFGVGEATFSDDLDDSNECEVVIKRNWSLSDNCGNAAADQVQTITIRDNTIPTFTAPADIAIYREADCSYDASVAVTGDVTNEADNHGVGEATYSDAVDASNPCEVVITRTWSLKDDCDNKAADQIQVITVRDNTPPTFTAPVSLTIYRDAAGHYDSTVAATGDVTDETDNCGVGEATFVDVIDQSDDCNVVITRTWSLTDNCSNDAADQVQVITVRDNTPPTFTAPGDLTIYRKTDGSYDASTAVTGKVEDEADNFGVGKAAFTDVVDDSDVCDVTIKRTWTLSDNCGNAAVPQVQTITIRDNTAPTFTAPADVTVHRKADGSYDASIAVTGDVTDEDDNFNVGEASFTETIDNSDECGIVIKRTWSLSDDCGNAAAPQMQTITVIDNTLPTFTAPADITIYRKADGTYDKSIAATGDVTDEHDNFNGNEATFVDVVDDRVACEVTIKRTWSLIDGCGNAAADQVQTITARDNTPPSFTAPADVTVYYDPHGHYDVTTAATGDVTDEDDNLAVSDEATFTDAVDATNKCSVVIKRTWILSDDCGNAAAPQVQTITVEDNTVPTFTAPDDITLYRDAAGSYDAAIAVTGDVTDEADNLGVGEASFNDVVNDSDPCNVVITRTWSLKDDCDNKAADQVQVITILDNTAPTFTAPADIVIYKDGDCKYDASIAFTGDVTDEADNFGVGDAAYSDVVDAADPCEIVITRTWSLSDNCGNAAAPQVQTITVRDNTPPTFTAPADIVIYCDAVGKYNAATSATGDVEDEADNCDVGQATYVDDIDLSDDCNVVIKRTWSLVDHCGNKAADQVQRITVRDDAPPTFTAPADIVIYRDADCNYDASVTATGDVTDEHDNFSVEQATFVDVVDASDDCNVVITRTWSLVDHCGNAAPDQVQTITVRDNTPPTFTVPADIVIYHDAACSYDATITATGDVTDEADNCGAGEAVFTDNINDTDACEVIIKRTWTLTDNCGNVTQKVQTITVRDNTIPTFTAPDAITIYKDKDGNFDAAVAVTGDVTDEADNCNVGEATFADVIADGSCEGEQVISRTWSLADDCGNAAEDQVQVIVVKDTIKPNFTVPADIVIYKDENCEYDASMAVTGDVTDESDNCDTSLDATYEQVITPGECAGELTILRGWTLEDDCGNRQFKVQTISVRDNTPPTFTVPADKVIFRDAHGAFDSSVAAVGDVTDEADNCGVGEATFVDAINDTDPCGVIITRTWSLSDDCGNAAAEQVQVITVRDNTIPTFTAPADITIYKDADCNYDASVAATGDVTNEDDNYGVGEATFVDDINDDNPSVVIINRKWSLVDNCGNSAADQMQEITVRDNTPPTITCPADLVVMANQETCEANDVELGNASAADNCGTPVVTNNAPAVFPLGVTVVTWTATDASGNVSTCEQQVDVQAVPVATDDYIKVNGLHSTLDVLNNDTDCDDNIVPASVTIIDEPEHGSALVDNNGMVTYTAIGGYNGDDEFKYKITDADGLTDEAVVKLKVYTNQAPIAVPDEYEVAQRLELRKNVETNDSDPNDDKLECVVLTEASHGQITLDNNGDLTYTPEPAFVGDDAFEYQVFDTGTPKLSATARVVIHVLIDTDGDGIPDRDDVDDDDDGILDTVEGDGAVDTDKDGHPDSVDIDSDNDGIPDVMEGQPSPAVRISNLDHDGDGLDNVFDPDDGGSEVVPVDTDGDGTPDYRDLDSDEDHVPDSIEGHDDDQSASADTDPLNSDTDGDGLDDAFDTVDGFFLEDNPEGSNAPVQDTDNDGQPDWRDVDDDGDGKPTATLEDDDDNGDPTNDDCDLDGVKNYLDEDDDCELVIPNGFSPNEDGIHDRWVIDGLTPYPHARVVIFNRWGNKVFEQTDYGNEETWGADAYWNGEADTGLTIGSKKLPSATYYYIIYLKPGMEPYKGSVFINK